MTFEDKKKYEALVKDVAAEMEYFVQTELSKEFPHLKTFYLSLVKTDWNKKRRCHRGGLYKNGPGISIAMHSAIAPFYFGKHLIKDIVVYFYEYKSFDTNKHIGGYYCTTPDINILGCVAHEVAHAVQFFHNSFTAGQDNGHGQTFKYFYKILRKAFVNHKLECQKTLEKQYYSYKKEAIHKELFAA